MEPVQFKAGKRHDRGDARFRSAWEANYARYLNLLDIKWEYEKHEFEFTEIKRGTRYYLPDFYLPDEDLWVEVKGRLSSKCKTKLKRFRKYHFDEFSKLFIVIFDPFSKSNTNRKVMSFLVAELRMPMERIESYKHISNQCKLIIKEWE